MHYETIITGDSVYPFGVMCLEDGALIAKFVEKVDAAFFAVAKTDAERMVTG